MKAMVLCAGYGTRLGDLTREIPKPMLLVEGKPMLEHIIAHLRRQGFNQLAVNLHFRPEQIQDYFGDGARFGVQIKYSYEPQLLGTAGALKKMEPFFAGAPQFLVQYGDVVTNQELGPMLHLHREQRALGTLLVHRRTRSNSIIQLDCEQRVTGFQERPDASAWESGIEQWVNSGIGLFSPEILTMIPAGCVSDIPRDLFPRLVQTGRLFALPLTGYRCAVDSPIRLAELSTAARQGLLEG
jgi:mannose-1-phosphate guanylyltransferase